MKFKEGDRVHVTLLDFKDVDFYGTLTEGEKFSKGYFTLVDCTDKYFEENIVLKSNEEGYGEYEEDYYVLAEDEEDTKGGNKMPTIKRKVEMNLPQLIEWAWDNFDKVEGKNFKSNVKDVFGNYSTIHFSVDGYGFRTEGVLNNDTFTVEVEEVITEDTVLPVSLVVFEHNGNLYTERHNSKCINKLLCLDKKVKGSDTKTIYILNEGGTLTLIWTKEKGLVE